MFQPFLGDAFFPVDGNFVSGRYCKRKTIKYENFSIASARTFKSLWAR
jgi:hypothetical protein